MDPRACDGRTTVCPLWLLGGFFADLPPKGHSPLQAGAVELPDFELLRVDAIEATHVEHDHVPSPGSFAKSIGLDAAGLAERMMDCAPVELIVRHLIVAGEQLEVRHRNG